MNPSEYIINEMNEHMRLTQACLDTLHLEILKAADICLEAVRSRHTIFLFGNGGSAADASHIAAEFTGRYQLDRKGLPAICLNADPAVITSISNDFGYDQVYARQLDALARKGDVCIGITTSGRSANVTIALEKAALIGCHTIGLTGREGGEIVSLCNLSLIVPSQVTSRIQEMHILIGHMICHLVESRL